MCIGQMWLKPLGFARLEHRPNYAWLHDALMHWLQGEFNYIYFLHKTFILNTEWQTLTNVRTDYLVTITFIQRYKSSWKELSLCLKFWFSNPNIFGFQRRKPLIFQTMTFVRSNNISLKYQKFTTLGSKDIEIRKTEFVAKTQFLCP